MIRCQVVHIHRNSRGQAVRKEQTVFGETIQIGRASDCRILLPSPGVSMYHAVLRHGEDGRLYLSAQEGAELLVNDALAKQVECIPGTYILLGSFRLVIEENTGSFDVVIAIEAEDEARRAQARLPISIAELQLSKRRVAFWTSLVVVVIFLLLPLMQSLPATKGAKLPVSFLDLWNIGHMSSGHHSLASKCSTCHEKPFQPVADKACMSCHTTRHHIADPVLFEKAFRNKRCADCHPDHRGDLPIERLDKQCVSCHGNIKAINPRASHTSIQDFSVDHPDFKLTLKTGHGERDFREVTQIGNVKEKSGLKFSHLVHLNKKGISTPDGDTVMVCQDCHLPDDAGLRFNPISMEKSCQQSGCHALDFDPPVADRPLPHGSVPKLMDTLREYYAKAAVDEMLTSGTRECAGEPTTGKNLLERVQSCAKNQVGANLHKLFTSKEGCVECHEVSPQPENADEPWKVHAIQITQHWLRHAAFSHSRHATSRCTDCHDKENSRSSGDISIPDIKKCRTCHVGAKEVKGKVSTSCEACHVFHRDEDAVNKKLGGDSQGGAN